MDKDIDKILNHLYAQRGFDFMGYNYSMLGRRIRKRIFETNTKDLKDYLNYLEKNPKELDNLIDNLTINVSGFFRNPLQFEYLSKRIIPKLVNEKIKDSESLRIWSCGCSKGEEPYSVAIMIQDYLEKDSIDLNYNIFASDIDQKAIKAAQDGIYDFDSIKNIKYRILKKYFVEDKKKFILDSSIKDTVNFSQHDLLDKDTYIPIDSIYGDFDIVFCCNVLIYFNLNYQKYIHERLYKSLKDKGFLVLGEAEIVSGDLIDKFKRINDYKIYMKSE